MSPRQELEALACMVANAHAVTDAAGGDLIRRVVESDRGAGVLAGDYLILGPDGLAIALIRPLQPRNVGAALSLLGGGTGGAA